jgi:hypothetical protein
VIDTDRVLWWHGGSASANKSSASPRAMGMGSLR